MSTQAPLADPPASTRPPPTSPGTPATSAAPPSPSPRFGFNDVGDDAVVRFTVVQKVVGAAILVLFAAAATWFAFTSRPSSTARPELFGGSLVLSNASRDNPTVVDLASGNPTLIITVGEPFGFPLSESKEQRANLRYVRSVAGDYVVNRTNGDTNLLRSDHLVVNRKGPYKLPPPTNADTNPAIDGVTAKAVADRLFLIRHSAAATDVVLIGADEVRAAGPDSPNDPSGIAIDAGSSATDTSSAVADDSLWLLVNNGAGKELRRISEPAAADERLLITTTVGSFGSRSQVVAVGSAIVVIDPDAASAVVLSATVADPRSAQRVISLPSLRDAVEVQPADQAAGQSTNGASDILNPDTVAWFAYYTGDRWQTLGVPTGIPTPGGEASAAAAPSAVVGPYALPLDAKPGEAARPVLNSGSLYAASRTDGRVVRVDAASGSSLEPAEGAASGAYPDKPDADGATDLAGNPAAFRDVELFTSGPRVVVNVPVAKRAILYETDAGIRRDIVKTEAPEIDPTAPPTPGNKAQDNSSVSTSTTAPQPGAESTTTSSIAVQKELPCEERDQQPRKPRLTDNYVPSAREVRIEWTYDPDDPRDCFPSKYRIEVQAGEGNGTPPPAAQWVTSTGNRHAAVVGGLRPNRRWRVTVVAALGQRETASDSIDVDTTETGPDAARSATVDATREGGWTVGWDACSGDACDREATEWEVTIDASVCANSFPLATVPPKLTVAGRNRGRFVSLDELPADFVGSRVRFGVVGIDRSFRSDATTWTDCAEGWRAPRVTPDFEFRADPTGDTFRLVAQVDQAAMDPRVVGSHDAVLEFRFDNVSAGIPSTALQATKDGVAPRSRHSASVQVSHHGRLAPPIEKLVDTNALPWTTPNVAVTPVGRLSADDRDPNFDIGQVAVTFTNVPVGNFEATAAVRCGVSELASTAFIVAAPGNSSNPLPWNIAAYPAQCNVVVSIAEQVAAGDAPRYNPAEVGNSGQWPIFTTSSTLDPPTGTLTVGGWEPLPDDGASIYDASRYWRWNGTTPTVTEPAVGEWVDNGVVKVQYDVKIPRPNTRLVVVGSSLPECSVVLAAPVGEITLPARCFPMQPDGTTESSVALSLTTGYFGVLSQSLIATNPSISDAPRLPKPTAPPVARTTFVPPTLVPPILLPPILLPAGAAAFRGRMRRRRSAVPVRLGLLRLAGPLPVLFPSLRRPFLEP